MVTTSLKTSEIAKAAGLLGDWDKRKLGHSVPCPDCPFRKKSLPGYLGGFDRMTYVKPPLAGMPTSCHQKDFGAEDPRTRFCAGSCATIANDPEIHPLPEYEEAVQKVGARDDCHSSVQDFNEYHARNNHLFRDYSL